MPKFSHRHKRAGPNTVTKSDTPRAIGELLARRTPTLSQFGDQSTRQQFWQGWLSQQLPRELFTHVTGAVQREATLTLFAESAAWAARLRYALRDLQPALHGADPSVQQIKVRVLPCR